MVRWQARTCADGQVRPRLGPLQLAAKVRLGTGANLNHLRAARQGHKHNMLRTPPSKCPKFGAKALMPQYIVLRWGARRQATHLLLVGVGESVL